MYIMVSFLYIHQWTGSIITQLTHSHSHLLAVWKQNSLVTYLGLDVSIDHDLVPRHSLTGVAFKQHVHTCKVTACSVAQGHKKVMESRIKRGDWPPVPPPPRDLPMIPDMSC